MAKIVGPKCPICGAPGEQLLTSFWCSDEACDNWHDPYDAKRKLVHDRKEARAQLEDNARPLDAAENAALWEQGILFHLLDDLQQRIYEKWYDMPASQKRFVALISRRAGKTFTFSCIAIENAMRREGSLQHYGAMTTLQVQRMLIPTFGIILDSCPDHLKPKIYVRDKRIVWPHNGSELMLGGCEDHIKCDRFRGAYSDNWFIDEAGYIGPLNYLVQSVALPMLHARQGARITMYSNAPYSPAHDIVRFVELAQDSDCYFHATVYDSPRYSDQDIEEFAEAAGGKDSAEWKREYGCEIVVDEEHAIIPEWTVRADHLWVAVEDSFRARKVEPEDYDEDGELKSYVMEPLVREVERPQYFDTYTFVDVGFDPDLTSVLAGYWDFERARLVIEDERELSRMTTDQLADAIADVETIWDGYWAWQTRIHGAEAKPFQRIMDVDKQIQADLSVLHELEITQGNNQDLKSQVNRARQLVKSGKLIVHPRCVNLIAHLKAGCWDAKRSKFARPHKKPRPNERYYGHFDHLQGLILGHAHVQKSHNPFPAVPHHIHYTTHHISERAVAERQAANDGEDGLVRWGERLTERRKGR